MCNHNNLLEKLQQWLKNSVHILRKCYCKCPLCASGGKVN